MIELRSDTFTQPTAVMRERMAAAAVGNDGYGEDPTVNELERRAAELAGQESACLTPSGTMANLCGILAQVGRSQSVLAGHLSDVYCFESGGVGVLGGVALRPVRNQPDATLDPAELDRELGADPEDSQFARPAVICLETTHGLCGGIPLEPAYISSVATLAAARGARLHLDGARLFNAAAALGVTTAEIGRRADTVQFCLSKGLGAPVGSVIAGPADVIVRARGIRKLLGGAMRQAGIIAAAGLTALESPGERLRADHRHAQAFAEAISAIPGIVTLHPVLTNIVFFRVERCVDSHGKFLDICRRQGLAMSELVPGAVRAVFHSDVSAADAAAAANIVGVATNKL